MAPGIREACRLALADLYHHSIRLVAVNLVWGLGLLLLLGIATAGAPLLALVASPVLALPLVGMARLAGEIVRGRDVVLSDAWWAIRALAGRALAAGALIGAGGVVLLANIGIGLTAPGAPSLALAVAAAWGLLALVLVALPFWVLLADPAREGRGIAGAAREVTTLLLVEPTRLLALTLVVGAVVVVGTALVAAILTVGVAYAVLVTARVVVPAADRLAGPVGIASPSD
jgi:hypothetical protein